jgi:DNA-directed RNA polymerase specialized sigma24 family protein
VIEALDPRCEPPNLLNTITRSLRKLVSTGLIGCESDGRPAERFVASREEAAFEVLIQRHGPMVWGVCCRGLANRHDGEQAFQVRFVVLVHKAASIASRDVLAGWPRGVVRRTAPKGRASSLRRLTRETPPVDIPEPQAVQEEAWRDLRPPTSTAGSCAPWTLATCGRRRAAEWRVRRSARVPSGIPADRADERGRGQGELAA